jgi:hypothetical protein
MNDCLPQLLFGVDVAVLGLPYPHRLGLFGEQRLPSRSERYALYFVLIHGAQLRGEDIFRLPRHTTPLSNIKRLGVFSDIRKINRPLLIIAAGRGEEGHWL